jgi:hypothetical protein
VLELRIAPVEVGVDARLPAIVGADDQWEADARGQPSASVLIRVPRL